MENQVSGGHTQVLMDITQQTIYLMGASFVLGSLFTLFLLLVLEFVRRNKGQQV